MYTILQIEFLEELVSQRLATLLTASLASSSPQLTSLQMTRALQDRLALANIKINHGWERKNIKSLEPELELDDRTARVTSQASAGTLAEQLANCRSFI